MLHRFTALLAVLVLVIAACSSDEPAADPTTSVAPTTTPVSSTTTEPEPEPDPLATTVTTHEVDPESGDLVEIEETTGPRTYDALLDAGIEAGLWDELTGLELLLGNAVGAVPTDEVPGASFLLTREFTDLLHRAHAHSLSGEYSEEELAGIRHWYEMAVPNAEAMEMLETTSQNMSINAFRSTSVQTTDCAPIDADDFSSWGVVEGCYRMLAESVQGVTVRVFYPAWYDDDATNGGIPLSGLQSLVRSIDTFAGFGTVGDVDMIFSLVDTEESDETVGIANDDATWGEASRGGPCPITVFPLGFDGDFENTVAHEVWHCVQREMGFPRGTEPGTAWIVEGGAQYFANVVFPVTSFFSSFASDSKTTPLFDMDYGAWVWWQFLANREGNREVAQMHLAMNDAGDGGRAAMNGRGEQFQRFVIELIAGKIDGPVSLPPVSSVNQPGHRVSENDAGKELDLATGGFIAARHAIRYDKELRIFESNTSSSDIRLAMVKWSNRTSPDEWKEVFPEVRSECRRDTWYLVAATTETDASTTGQVTIDRIEKAVCDPCVLGTWSLDLQTFEDLIRANVGSAGGADLKFTGGAYYVAFDIEGKITEQRDNLTITATSQGQSLDMIIRSFGTGEYTADGENMTMTNLVDLFTEVDIGGFASGIDATDFAAVSGAGTYVCTDDDVTVTIPEGTVRWVRVDRILEPPPLP